jgi:tRNA (guanine37-N1)-methyltransferase
MWFGIISLFPEMFQALNSGITDRAMKNELLQLNFWNPRDFATDKHKTVDSSPYGGGPGMLMMASPLQKAIEAARAKAPSKPTVIYLSPQGKTFNQQAAQDLYAKKSIIMLSGRYEGVDQRIIDLEVDEEWSIGDYILTGGELAAMVMIDTITRLIPDAVGHADSVSQDSLSAGLLKYPQYTRPEIFADRAVPEILLSGHHKNIARWRRKQSLGGTWQKRPDLLAEIKLDKEDQKLLDEFIAELSRNS